MTKDAAAELARSLLCAHFVHFDGAVEKMISRPWSSVAFSGARHRFVLRIQGRGARSAAHAFLDGLDEHEFALRSHILADIAVLDLREDGEDTIRLTLEALTVEVD